MSLLFWTFTIGRFWNLTSESSLVSIHRNYQPSNQVILSMSTGIKGIHFRNLMYLQAKHFNVHQYMLTITNLKSSCVDLIGDCAYSSQYMSRDARFIIQRLRARVYWMYMLYRTGLDVFQLDSDIVWFANPLRISAEFPMYGIIGAEDGLPFNGGFVYARHVSNCSDSIIESLLYSWSRRLIEWGGDEQSTLIDIMSSMITHVPYSTEQELIMRGKSSVIPIREKRVNLVRKLAKSIKGENSYIISPFENNFSYPVHGLFNQTVPYIASNCKSTLALGIVKRFTYNLRLCKNNIVTMLHLSGFPIKSLRPSIVQLYRGLIRNESGDAIDEFRKFVCSSNK